MANNHYKRPPTFKESVAQKVAASMQKKAAQENVKNFVIDSEAAVFQRGSVQERIWVEQYERRVRDLDLSFPNIVAKQIQYTDSRNKLKERMNGWSGLMTYQMAMMACRPLMMGVNSDALIDAAGRTLGMALVSKDFRMMLKQGMASVMSNHYKRKMDNMMDRYNQNTIDGQPPMTKGDALRTSVGMHYAKWSDAYNKMKTGGRSVMTPQLAANIEVGMTIKAYELMRQARQSTENVDDIAHGVMDWYNKAISSVETMCKEDGLDLDDVNARFRSTAERISRVDPSLRSVFMEPANGWAVKVPSFKTDPENHIWMGEYETESGKSFQDNFHPRPPYDPERHFEHFDKKVRSEFKSCRTLDEFEQVAKDYMIGFAYSQNPMECNQYVDPNNQHQQRCIFYIHNMLDDCECYEQSANEYFDRSVRAAHSALQDVDPVIVQDYIQKYGSAPWFERDADKKAEPNPDVQYKSRSDAHYWAEQADINMDDDFDDAWNGYDEDPEEAAKHPESVIAHFDVGSSDLFTEEDLRACYDDDDMFDACFYDIEDIDADDIDDDFDFGG